MSLFCFSFTHSSLRKLQKAFPSATRAVYQGEQTASLSPARRATECVQQPHKQVSAYCRQNCRGTHIIHCYRTDTHGAKPSQPSGQSHDTLSPRSSSGGDRVAGQLAATAAPGFRLLQQLFYLPCGKVAMTLCTLLAKMTKHHLFSFPPAHLLF